MVASYVIETLKSQGDPDGPVLSSEVIRSTNLQPSQRLETFSCNVMFISNRVETTGKMEGEKFIFLLFPLLLMHDVGKSNLKPREAVQGCSL